MPTKTAITKQFFQVILLLSCSVLFCACDKEDLTAQLSETHGLQSGASVVWKGQIVGEVTGVEASQKGLIEVGIDLEKQYEDHFHLGLVARAIGDVDTPDQTRLNLYGGTDAQQPKLTSGGIIPEAAPTVGVSSPNLHWGFSAAIGILILLAVGSVLKKIIGWVAAYVAALGFAAAAIFYLSFVLDRHNIDLVPEAFSAQVDQFLATNNVPEHMEAWLDTVRDDALAAAEEAEKLGKEASAEMIEVLKEKTEQKLKEVEENSETAQELLRFQENIKKLAE